MDVTAALDLDPLRGDLRRVETGLEQAVKGKQCFFAEITGHLLGAGGKRLRPALTLFSAYAAQVRPSCKPASKRVIAGATAMELLHLGSLYHDDVMDEADVRRGVISTNARWGNVLAVLGGDQLLARASVIAAALGTTEGRLVASTLDELCTGQALETRDLYDANRDEATYLASIDGKTAALMASSCRMGALEAGADVDTMSHLSDYGRHLGMAFQILDDVLDLVGDERTLGKPVGNDVAEGVYTLPIILSQQRSPQIRLLLGGRDSAPDIDRVRSIVREDGSIEDSLRQAEGELARARESLRGVSNENGAVRALDHLAVRLLDPVASCVPREAHAPDQRAVLSAVT